LTINEYPVTPDETIEETVCEGEVFTYEGNEYNAGSYEFPQTDDNGCTYLITLIVNEFDATMVSAGDDVTICIGDEIMLTASGDGTFEWSTGETGPSIIVSPSIDTTYTVTATSEEGCAAEDTVEVFVDEKVTIGDYVFEDANFNGMQDEMDTGVNGITVMLYSCSDQGNTNGMFIDSIVTTNNPITGEPGYYSFEVCPNSGPYYLTFSDIPKDYEFTGANVGDDTLDSDANSGGVTDCFEIGDMDDTTRDAGIVNPSCRITIGNKILPKYPANTWIEQNSDTACIGDSFLLWAAKDPSNFGNSSTYNGEDFVGYTFTYTTPTGDITTYSDSSQSSYRFEVLGLDEEDFGIYTITYSGPDGCAGIMEFELTLGDECLEDGTRPSDFAPINPIASIFPVPATSGSTLTIVINTENGRINTNSDLNSVNLSAMLPANKENIGISLFDKNGRMVNPVRTYDITKGSDVVEYPLEYLSSGTYILRVDGNDWSDSKQVIIK
ncbi:SdrD B-like domain-containing protein, partial [Croceitalea sp. P059]|uniref:SdrD B-like domain-containing protein n=1 Tax=Croceitalea sp. P059 TaxID=3075601 RepID=UPI002888D03D